MQTQQIKNNGTTKKTAEDVAPTTADTSSSTEKAPEKVELTPVQKKAHMEKFQKLRDDLDSIELKAETAREALRAHAKTVYDSMGPGPFLWKGAKLKVAKNPKGGGYTFRGESQAEVEEIA